MSRIGAIFAVIIALAVYCVAQTPGPVPGPNVNMVSGVSFPGGDPYLQRQNEPSMAVSTRNPQHLLAGANDYRSVDIPFPPDSGIETGDAWLGLFKSNDGGQTWYSTLLAGYPQDNSDTGKSSPLHAYGVATDPTVRAGTHGLFYYSGLAFNRGNNAPSAIFVATLQDQNNKGNGDPFAYLGAVIVDTGNTGQFMDKPWLAVDIPRPGTSVGAATCNLVGAAITSGNAYLVYSKFLGQQPSTNPHSQITFAKSTNCGATWSKPVKLSESYTLNQGTTAAIDPATGALYIAWRQIANGNQPDALLYAVSYDGGQTFTKAAPIYVFAPGTAFDQNASASSFRAMTLPTMAVDAGGRVWVAWSQRNLGAQNTARIVISTLPSGSSNWTTPYVADSTAAGAGHQFFPSMVYAYGKLMLIFYDQRDDHTKGILQCTKAPDVCTSLGDYRETRQPMGTSDTNVFAPVISDAGLKVRHTVDVRGVQIEPAQVNVALPSFRISQYKYGSLPGDGPRPIEQLQFNPPNFPMFVKGTRGFIGDYIEVTGLNFVTDASGAWKYNTSTANAAVFHATWTDNRDVRPPKRCDSNGCIQDWTQYTPVGSTGGQSLYDQAQQKPACTVNQTGSRNQNVYTSRISQGLVLALKENFKPLGPATGGNVLLQRAFSVLVQNNRNSTAYYRLTIYNVPQTATASFSQTEVITQLDLAVAARSVAARTVFVSSPAAIASVSVRADEIDGLQGTVLAAGLKSSVIINPDISNPDIANPDIINPDITNPDIANPDISNPDIKTAEVYNPTVSNPDIANPDIANPDITNPDISNPDIANPDIANPDITTFNVANPDIINPDIANPDIANPDIFNPDIINPDIANPDIASFTAGATDFTWKLTNTGNTSAAYNAKLFRNNVVCCPSGCPGASNCPATCYKCQLVLRRTYPTPAASGCTLVVEAQNVPVASIGTPTFTDAGNAGTPDQTSGDVTNATFALGPGEAGRVTLRVFGLHVDVSPPSLPKSIAVSSGANTGESAAAASLAVTTLELPVGVVGATYGATVTAIGGTGARTFSLYNGSLPAGLALDVGGTITGTPESVGTSTFTVQVQDSPVAVPNAPPPSPHIDRALLSITVSSLSMQNVTASTVRGDDIAKAGDTVTIQAVVANAGPAVASNVVAGVTVNGNGISATCGPATPASASIAPDQIATFTYQCTVGGEGDGSVTFSVGATARYVNSAGSVLVTAPARASNPIVVDNTPPVLTVSAAAGGTPYTAGTWTNHDVVVTYACTDALSGVADGNPTTVALSIPGGAVAKLTAETPVNGVDVTGHCADRAGNSAAPLAFGPVLIDKTPPTLEFGAATPAANAAGWHNTNVTVAFTASDALSGVETVSPAALVLTAEGANVTGSVTVTDRAGNSATFTSPAVKIDKTPPVITASRAPAPNAAGWNNTDVTVSFACNDVLSGVNAVSAPVVIGSEGLNLSASGSCSDIAGNSATTSLSGIKIDKTPPAVTITTPADGSSILLNSSATVAFGCTDALAGVASCSGTQPAGSALATSTLGVRTFTVNAADAAGNTTIATSTYTIAYRFIGFLTPLAPAGTVASPTFSGSSTLGKAVPVKWQLTDAKDVFISDLSALAQMIARPVAYGRMCPTPPATGDILLYSPSVGATGNSTFRYSSNQSVFTWDTTYKATQGCYELIVTLKDTKQYATIIQLK